MVGAIAIVVIAAVVGAIVGGYTLGPTNFGRRRGDEFDAAGIVFVIIAAIGVVAIIAGWRI